MSLHTDAGLALEDVAQSCYFAFCNVQDVKATWDALSDSAEEGWYKIAALGFDLQAADAGKSAVDLARMVYATWGQGGEAWDQLPVAAKLHWEAVGRHLCGLLSLDSRDGTTGRENEAVWREWFKKKLKLVEESNGGQNGQSLPSAPSVGGDGVPVVPRKKRGRPRTRRESNQSRR